MNESADSEVEDIEFYESHADAADKEKLRTVAKWQRAVICALLANIVINIVLMSFRDGEVLAPLLILGLAFVVVLIAVASIALLANELYGTGLAVLCAVLMFVPCISLITMLIVNQKATGFLQSHGVKVGFLGVNPDRI